MQFFEAWTQCLNVKSKVTLFVLLDFLTQCISTMQNSEEMLELLKNA